MKRPLIVIVVILLICLASYIVDFIKVSYRINLLWNYNYSSDVAQGIVFSKNISHSNENRCNVNYSNIRITESFKGELRSGNIIKAIGIEAHEYREVGSKHFLLLKPFLATEFPGFGNCKNEDFQDYFVIHHWCCSINSQQNSFNMRDMINSEKAGDIYLVPVEATYTYLRWHKLIFAE